MTDEQHQEVPLATDELDEGGAIGWMTKNPVAANLLMVALIVGGLLMSFRVKKEVFPQIELDRVDITIPYPGASPAEVEQGILLAVEEAVRSLDDVKKIESTAGEGYGSVTVELQVGADRNKALSDVKNAIDRISSFPEESERPIVNVPEWRAEAISLVLYGDQEEKVMFALGEQVRDELLRLPQVTYAELVGVRPLEMSIEVPQETLRTYGLTLPQIARMVRNTAIELPAGGVKTPGGEFLLRTAERRDLAAEFANIPVITATDGSQVRLEEIAEIEDGFAETDIEAAFEGKPSVMIDVSSVGDQSPTDVAEAVKKYAKRLEKTLPPGVAVTTWNDNSRMYDDRLDLLMRNAMLGLALVLFILGLFLEPKLAFWVTMGIPISFMGSLVLLPALGVSLNMISLFGFIVTLGMVVDDAIVVGENAFRMRRKGLPFLKAAIYGAKQVSAPVFFSIATTVTAFSPLLFVPGTRGKWMIGIPIVVILVLAISLIESFFILPAHLGHLSPDKKRRLFDKFIRLQARFSQGVERFIEGIYKPVASAAVHRRWLTLAIAITMFLGTLGLVHGGRVKVIDFPKEESDWVVAVARLPFGSPVQDTREVMKRMVEGAQEVIKENGGQEISTGIFSMLGVAFGRGGGANGSHVTSVAVTLVPTDQRPIGAGAFADKWREKVGQIAGLESLNFDSSTGHGGSKPIDIEISHSNIDVLESAARELAAQLGAFEGVKDVEDGIELGKPQLDFTLSDEGIAAGLTSVDLAAQVRAAYYGAEALRQQRGRNEMKVMVRLPRSERESLHSVEEMIVRTPSGGEMPLRHAASVKRGRAYTSIERTDGKRTVRVKADVEEGKANPQEIMGAVFKNVMPDLQSRHEGLGFGSAGRQKDMQDFFDFLFVGFLMALIAMYGLIAIPLRSYLQPFFVVMMAIPFGFVGAVLGHLLMGMSLSMISMMGLVALSGVVVNDSIVLVAAANRFRRRGHKPVDAALAAAVQRFRPIILTSLTTFGGLAPMIFETSLQARILIPMAVSLGFGVLFSTLIILLLVPALFVIIENFREWRARRKERALTPSKSMLTASGTGRMVAILLAAGLALGVTSKAGADEREAGKEPTRKQELELPAITPGEEISLQEALRLADKRNLSLAAASIDIIKAQADLKSAWSLLLPTASASLTFTHNDHPDYVGFGPETFIARRQDDLAGGIQVNVPLINVGSWFGVGLADLGEELAVLSVERMRQGLLLSVAQAYYQALTAKALIDVQRNQIASSQRHLKVASIRHRSGTGSRLDVIRARTELLSAREELIAAHAALDNSRDALAALLDVQGLPLPSESPDMSPPAESEKELLARAGTQREDLKLARKNVQLADKSLDTTWMQFLPSLNGSWQFSYQITEPSSFRSEDKSRWFYAITLSVPIYDHTRYADLDGKRAELHKAELEAAEAEIQARLEVRQARRNYEKAMQQVATAQKKADLAKQALELAETAYENGTGGSLDVTDARRSSRDAQIDLALKRFESQLSLLTLLRAVGQDMSRLGSD